MRYLNYHDADHKKKVAILPKSSKVFAKLSYERGTIRIEGNVHVPYAKWDGRSGCYRALAYKYRDIVDYLKNSGVEFEDHVTDNVIPAPIFDADIKLRDYQTKATKRWMADKRGIVVLPTGSGKTHIALKIINDLSVATLIVVPTLALLEQWKERLSIFGKEFVGEFSGRKKELKPITVTTYDSAYINAEYLGDKFLLIIFDECLTYDTPVLTDIGWLPIGYIVENRLNVRVLTHRGRFKPVVGWHKIPLMKRLVRVVLEDGTEIKCTEDHRFLTNRGWVEAIDLDKGDELYKINEKVLPDLWRGSFFSEETSEKQAQYKTSALSVSILLQNISERICPWRTCKYSSCESSEECGYCQKAPFEEDKPRAMEESSSRGYGAKGSMEDGNKANRGTKKSHTRNDTWRWVSDIAKQEKQECKAGGETLYKPIRIRYVEILHPKKYYTKEETENRKERRIWKECCCSSNDVFAMPNGALQNRLSQRTEGYKQIVAKGNKPSDSLSNVDHGRWFEEPKHLKDISRENIEKRSKIDSELAKIEVECRFKDLSTQRMDSMHPEEGKFKKSCEVDKAVCYSFNEIQDFVYDLTVAEDHSYIANGVIVHNCHHLPAESYRQIAEMSMAPYRLGLTAVYEREDGLHSLLPDLIGGIVFELKPDDLAGRYLARYEVRRIFVPLSEEEKRRYNEKAKVFKEYIVSKGIRLENVEDFRKIVMLTGLDEKAYEALKSWDEARKIAFNSKNKLKKLKELLERHRNDKIIIFTRYNDLVYTISRAFLIPAVTHKTDKKERDLILEGFRKGKFKAIVSSQVLDEGIDVPDANVGIIVSGTGSSREFIQRLGRLLRPAEGKDKAILYELISKETGEVRVARRRKKSLRD